MDFVDFVFSFMYYFVLIFVFDFYFRDVFYYVGMFCVECIEVLCFHISFMEFECLYGIQVEKTGVRLFRYDNCSGIPLYLHAFDRLYKVCMFDTRRYII